MAEATADQSTRDCLEQKVLQMLRDADHPLRTPELVKRCQVPKKELNRVLYSMKEEHKVSLAGPATWSLGEGGPAGTAPTELAWPSLAQRPQQDAPAVAESPGLQPSEKHERIYKFLEANGPSKALHIAQALGMKTAKDVNPDLYKMNRNHLLSYDERAKLWMVYISAQRPQQDAPAVAESPGPQPSEKHERIYKFLEASGPSKALHIAQALGMKTAKDVNPDLYKMNRNHLLSYDERAKLWMVYISEDSGRRLLYQQNPINVIYQNGPNSHISITNSEAIQIGHGNIIQRQRASAEDAKPSPPEPHSAAWGPQDIRMERSVFRWVQLGHSNEMNLLSTWPQGPATSLPASPPVSATTSLEASFDVQMSKPGSHPESDIAQRVHIRSCLLEDAALSNGNKMTIHPGAAGPSGAAGSGDGRREPGLAAEDAGPHCEATRCRSNFHHDLGQAPLGNATLLTATLRAVALASSSPEATEQGLSAAGAPDSESC